MKSKGSVIAVGGAEDKIKKRAILVNFIQAAGGSRARIAIIPVASMMPQERGDLYASIFREMGVAAVDVLDIERRDEANDPGVIAPLLEATGVFVTGGVQLRLITLLGGTKLSEAVTELVARGGVYCGTSAGAAAASSHMIVTGRTGMRVRRSMVDLAPGLGLVTPAIIDQHFSQRGRFGRLIAAVAMNPQLLGIGVDEDTAAVFDSDGMMTVLGGAQVAIIDAASVTTNLHTVSKSRPFTISGLLVHLLTEGDRFDLKERVLSTAHAARPKLTGVKG